MHELLRDLRVVQVHGRQIGKEQAREAARGLPDNVAQALAAAEECHLADDLPLAQRSQNLAILEHRVE